MESGLGILGQLLLLSLVIERVIQTFWAAWKNTKPTDTPPKEPEPWGRAKIVCAAVIGAFVSYGYKYDLLSIITGVSDVGPTVKWIGIGTTATVLAGGQCRNPGDGRCNFDRDALA